MSERPRFGFYAAVMATCLILSMAGNGLHVWSQWHGDVAAGVDRGAVGPWVPTLAIMIAPAMVMVMTEAVILAHGRNRGRARTVVTGLAVVVGLIALAVSYSGLVYVCDTIIGLPVVLAYAAPMIVDLPIIAATVGLWDVVDQARRPGDDQVVTTATGAPVEQVVTPDDQVVDTQLDTLTSTVDEQLVTLATSDGGDVVDFTRRPARHPADQARHRVEHMATTSSPALVRVVDEQVDTGVVTPVDEMTSRGDGQPDEQLVTLSTSTPDEGLVAPVDDQLVTPDEFARRADEILASSGISADVDELATVLSLHADGASKASIATAVGRSRSTVTGWINAAERLDAASV